MSLVYFINLYSQKYAMINEKNNLFRRMLQEKKFISFLAPDIIIQHKQKH